MVMPLEGADTKGGRVPVIYVEKKSAKQIKNLLEGRNEMNKDFRMSPAIEDQWKETIAVPIRKEKEEYQGLDGVVGAGYMVCPHSTSLLGNHTGKTARANGDSSVERTLSEQALLTSAKLLDLPVDSDNESTTRILSSARNLDRAICPKKLEYLGDDRTLVLPRRAFSLSEPSFREFLVQFGCSDDASQESYLLSLWKQLAAVHESPRVVRRGEIASSSGIRQSKYRLLWPFDGIPETTGTHTLYWTEYLFVSLSANLTLSQGPAHLLGSLSRNRRSGNPLI
jgi:hypothetical protein